MDPQALTRKGYDSLPEHMRIPKAVIYFSGARAAPKDRHYISLLQPFAPIKRPSLTFPELAAPKDRPNISLLKPLAPVIKFLGRVIMLVYLYIIKGSLAASCWKTGDPLGQVLSRGHMP